MEVEGLGVVAKWLLTDVYGWSKATLKLKTYRLLDDLRFKSSLPFIGVA